MKRILKFAMALVLTIGMTSVLAKAEEAGETEAVLEIETGQEEEPVREEEEQSEEDEAESLEAPYTEELSISLEDNPEIPEGALFITAEPEDSTVSFPEGTFFHVEVNDPSLVRSYQWYLYDSEGYPCELDGSSAKEDTLIIPGTTPNDQDWNFSCVITGTDGTVIETRLASLTVNVEEMRNYMLVGDRVLLEGDRIDLAEEGFGSGTITFTDSLVTFDHASFTREEGFLFDSHWCRATALELYYPLDDTEKVTFRLTGDATFRNFYSDEQGTGNGIWLYSHSYCTDMVFEGDGTLTLIDCLYPIYNFRSDVTMDTDLNIISPSGYHSRGILCRNFKVCRNRKFTADVVRLLVNAEGKMIVEPGAELNLVGKATRTLSGMDLQTIVNASEGFEAEDAVISITGKASAETIEQGGVLSGFLAVYTDSAELKNTKMNIRMSIEDNDQYPASSIGGLVTKSGAIQITDGSEVTIDMDTEAVSVIIGMESQNGVLITDSSAAITEKGLGDVYGMRLMGTAEIDRSNVTIEIDSDSMDGEGIFAEGLDLDLVTENDQLAVSTNNGLPLRINTGAWTVSRPEYDESYEAARIGLSDTTRIVMPEDGVISHAGYFDNTYEHKDAPYEEFETVYSESTGEISPTAIFRGGEPSENAYEYVGEDTPSWTKGSEEDLKMTFRAKTGDSKTIINKFTELYVDDKQLTEGTDFDLEPGSLIVKLKPEFLQTLSATKHTLKVCFKDGSGSAKFRIREKSSGKDSSSDESASSASSPNGVITCQMAGYPEGYAWNESAKACQYGYPDASGSFRPGRKTSVVNTADQGISGHLFALIASLMTAVLSGYVLKRM